MKVINLKNLVRSIAQLPATVFAELKLVGTELSLVDWISRKETLLLTFIVIVTTILFVGLLIGIDNLLLIIRNALFNRNII